MMSTRGNAIRVRPRLVLLVAALVLAVALPVIHSPAAHADQYGPSHTAEYDGRGWRGMGGTWCNVAGYWRTTSTISQVVFDAHCELGSGANGHKVRFTTQAGPCELTGPEIVMPNPGDVGDASGYMAMLDVSTGCGAVTELCFEHASEGFFGDGYKDWTSPKCVPWNLGSPPLAGPDTATDAGGCAHTTGVPTSPDRAQWYDANSNHYKVRQAATVNVTTASKTVHLQAVWRSPTGTLYASNGAPFNSASGAPWFNITGTTGVIRAGISQDNWTSRITGNSAGFPGWQLVGIQVWLQGAGIPTVDTTKDRTVGAGHLGVTNGTNCSWWFGEDIASDPVVSPYIPGGPEGGDPVGTPPDGTSEPPVYDPPGDTEPTPEDDGTCGDFSLTDPGSWAGAAMCAVVRVIIELIRAVEGVISAIGGLVVAIGELLAGLFIPSAEGITDALDGLRSSLETGPLGEWTGSFSDAFSGGTAGSCEGPEVDLTTLGVPGVEPLRPFAACSGPMADAAVTVRLVATVTVGITGGLFIVRMLTSALGINVPSPGRKETAT